MKVCMITTMTPSSEKIRGTSALPYHLIKGCLSSNPSPEGEGDTYTFTIYTFNNNMISDEKIAEVEKELAVRICKVPLPKWFFLVFKFRLLFIRLFLKYPLHHYVKLPQQYVDEIKAKKPDLIWVYGAEWSRVVNQFDGFQRIHTLPDSEALFYYRMLGQRFVTWDWKKFFRCAIMYPKFLALERDYSKDSSIHYHLVGEEDANFLRKMNPGIQAHFIRHPHYNVNDNDNGNLIELQSSEVNVPVDVPVRNFHQPKIRVLIAGQYNFYMKQEADLLVGQICNVNVNDNVNSLKEHYVFTFLGKGWEKHVETLRRARYEVEHITFAPDYICKHDIQITPIAIGTGTKGKVLDALANGLLVIGTPFALENIVVKHSESCIEYRQPQEVIDVLLDIPNNIRKYEAMAEAGRRQVLERHNREKISRELFGLFS